MAVRYLVSGKDGDHLPVSGPDGKLDHRLMGAAWAALHGGYRGNTYEGPGKPQAIEKLKALYKSEGMDLPETNSEIVNSELAGPKFTIHNSLFPRFVIRLAEIGTTGLARVPLAITGQWVKNGVEFSITHDDLDDLLANFQKRLNGEVNVDYDHASEMPEVARGGPLPSAGRIVGLDPPERFVNGVGASRSIGTPLRFILYGHYEPTEHARELIRNREYRYISPAIDWGARSKQTGKRQGTTLTSVALTNRPFLEELPEIRLSDPGYVSVGPTLASATNRPGQAPALLGEKTMKNLELKNIDGAHHVFDGEEPVGVLADDHLRGYVNQYLPAAADGGDEKEKASEAARAAVLSELGVRDVETARRAVSTSAEAERAEKAGRELARIYLSEKPDEEAGDKLLASGAVTLPELRGAERARKRVDQALGAGKILPLDRAVAFRIAFADAKAFDEWIAKRPAYPRLGPPSGIAGNEIDSAHPRQQLAELVRRKKDELKEKYPARSEQLLFDQATQLVRKENPELFRRYREEKA